MISRRSLAFFLLVLFSITPAALGGRNVVLAPYYWSNTENRWVSRGSKTTFAPGDYVLIADDRVTFACPGLPPLVCPGSSGPIPYYLEVRLGTPHLSPDLSRITVAEKCINKIIGPPGTLPKGTPPCPLGTVPGGPGECIYPFLQSEFEGFAALIPVPPGSYTGSLSATFFYADPVLVASGLSTQQSLLEPPVDRPGIADIVRPATPPPGPPSPSQPRLSIQAPGSSVLINSNFTLTAQLEGVSFSTFSLAAKLESVNFTAAVNTSSFVWTQTPSTGTPAATVVGPPNQKTITYTAPGVEGTLTFKVTSKISNQPDLESSPVTIAVVRQITQPPPSTGTPVGRPPAGKKPAQASINAVPTDVKVNVPFTLSAWANDPDGTPITCDPDTPQLCPRPEDRVPSLTGRWEKIGGEVLKQATFKPVSATENKLFDVTITEPNPGTYTYRFTVTNAVGAGNYYEVQVTVGTGAPVNNGPVIRFATPPPTTADVDTVVTLDASASTTITGKDLQFTWTLKIENTDLAFTAVAPGKISFRVPLSAGGKKIVGSVTAKDVENRQNSQNFEINVSVPPIRALAFSQIRGIVNEQRKTDAEILGLYGIDAPQFTNYFALLNPTGEKGKKELISIRSVDAEGNALSDYYRSVDLGTGSIPYARQIDKLIPEEALVDSQVVKVNSLSRLAGIAMVVDTTLPRMDAFDLSSKTGTDWALPYLFKSASRTGLGRESFGIVTIQNASNEDAEVQAQYYMRLGNTALQGQKFTIKAGGSKTLELSDYFGLGQLNDPPGYAAFTATKNIQVVGLFGDSREMFAIPGVRKEDFGPSAIAPVAFRSNEWETVISVINGQNKDVTMTVQLLNNSTDFPTDLKGKQFTWSLKPGSNDITLAELVGKPLDIPFTALKLSVDAGNIFAGSVLLKNLATGAEALWPLLNATTDSFIYPHVVQGADWQNSFVISNLGSATASLKAGGVLLVRDDKGNPVSKVVQGLFSIPAGTVVAALDLAKFGINQSGDVLGGYLKIEPASPGVNVNLVPAGLLFHTKGKGGIIDGLSLVPAVK